MHRPQLHLDQKTQDFKEKPFGHGGGFSPRGHGGGFSPPGFSPRGNGDLRFLDEVMNAAEEREVDLLLYIFKLREEQDAISEKSRLYGFVNWGEGTKDEPSKPCKDRRPSTLKEMMQLRAKMQACAQTLSDRNTTYEHCEAVKEPQGKNLLCGCFPDRDTTRQKAPGPSIKANTPLAVMAEIMDMGRQREAELLQYICKFEEQINSEREALGNFLNSAVQLQTTYDARSKLEIDNLSTQLNDSMATQSDVGSEDTFATSPSYFGDVPETLSGSGESSNIIRNNDGTLELHCHGMPKKKCDDADLNSESSDTSSDSSSSECDLDEFLQESKCNRVYVSSKFDRWTRNDRAFDVASSKLDQSIEIPKLSPRSNHSIDTHCREELEDNFKHDLEWQNDGTFQQ